MTMRKKSVLTGVLTLVTLAMTTSAWAGPVAGHEPPSIIAILIGLVQRLFS